jgi:hypothetical protein
LNRESLSEIVFNRSMYFYVFTSFSRARQQLIEHAVRSGQARSRCTKMRGRNHYNFRKSFSNKLRIIILLAIFLRHSEFLPDIYALSADRECRHSYQIASPGRNDRRQGSWNLLTVHSYPKISLLPSSRRFRRSNSNRRACRK